MLQEHMAEPFDSSIAGLCRQVAHRAEGMRTEPNEGGSRKNACREAGRTLFFTWFPSLSSEAFILKVAR